jgi:hypothetical protein
MSIRRFENITVNNLTFGKNGFGEQSTTQAAWFQTRAEVHDVSNNLRISEKYRLYQDMVNLTIRYTPNAKEIVDNQNLYSITWRGNDWRITDVRESNERMSVKMMCYRTDPVTAV